MTNNNDAPSREVARRVFASEFNDALYTFKESEDDKAPVYALLPTGQKANRVLFVATLLETENVGRDDPYWRGKLVGPTGSAFVYAGQYQPDCQRRLEAIETPAYVSVIGKPRTYETDDGETRVSIRPESITTVDEETRHAWVAETAEATLNRIEAFDPESDQYDNLAAETYDRSGADYTGMVIETLEDLSEEVEANEVEAETPDLAPDATAD